MHTKPVIYKLGLFKVSSAERRPALFFLTALAGIWRNWIVFPSILFIAIYCHPLRVAASFFESVSFNDQKYNTKLIDFFHYRLNLIIM